jgi:hypothetical protein
LIEPGRYQAAEVHHQVQDASGYSQALLSSFRTVYTMKM